ncbi:unnamed protein product [Protopolystoma xenopodis]|uniref:Uncharacterized protein n=1 Tax=Protopolystoma xenopodis TaxID=117903 RepID=A0A3S5CV31_9PLAT|nr:unnamed protein product [Protopolystoma xenopodis]
MKFCRTFSCCAIKYGNLVAEMVCCKEVQRRNFAVRREATHLRRGITRNYGPGAASIRSESVMLNGKNGSYGPQRTNLFGVDSNVGLKCAAKMCDAQYWLL